MDDSKLPMIMPETKFRADVSVYTMETGRMVPGLKFMFFGQVVRKD
jgi:hypothetical protein